jgi:hypothetical protein
MGTLHVNFKSRRDSMVGTYEKVTTSGVSAVTTEASPGEAAGKTTAAGSVIELYSVGGVGLLVSIGTAPSATADTGKDKRFFLPPDYPICIENVGPGMKVAAIDAP